MIVPGFIGFLWLCLCCQLSFSQNPIFQNEALNKDPSTYRFSLTSNSDCSDGLKNIYDFDATVIGYELNSLDTGPTDCTIRLTSQDQFPNIQLGVQIISANILDCETTLGIYDGQEGGKLLESFDCRSIDLRNQHTHPTSGDTVTFRFKRPNPSSYNFDIEIRVFRLRGGPDPDDRWGWGQDYFFDKFPQETIVGLIGGLYLLLLIVCIGVIIYFNFKYQGRLKRWETHQLATMKTGTTFGSRSQVNEPSRIWTMEMADKGPSSYYSRSQAETYSRKPRGTSEDGSSVVYDHDDSFQRNLMSNKRDQSRDRLASENTNFAIGDSDQDDPDHFEEKVIRPRWRPRNRERKDHRPPSFEEAVSERSSRHSSDESEEEETDSSDDSIRKKRLTSSEEESSRSSRSSTGTESESDDDNSRRGARARRLKERQKKDKRRRRSSTDGETSSYRSGPRQKRPAAAPAAAAPYAAYPPGQFVPVMAGPPNFQPVHMVPNYAPPQYPDEPQAMQRQPQVRPTDPPVYSYLVRRGYTPMEPNAGRNSPASNGSQRGPAEEPEAPLQSGVEYMRR